MISKVFTLFCREFGNVVNHAFLVLIFWEKNLVGAIFSAFCNYEVGSQVGQEENGEWWFENATAVS